MNWKRKQCVAVMVLSIRLPIDVTRWVEQVRNEYDIQTKIQRADTCFGNLLPAYCEVQFPGCKYSKHAGTGFVFRFNFEWSPKGQLRGVMKFISSKGCKECNDGRPRHMCCDLSLLKYLRDAQ